MNVKILLAMVIGLSSGALIGQDEGAPHPIDVKMQKQMDLNPSTAGQIEATDAALVEWNNQLNKQYKRLMKSLGKEAQDKLRSSQKSWITWRDLEIQSLGAIYGNMEGTMWLPANRYAVMNLTRQRAKQLSVFNSFYGEVFEIEIRGQKVEIEPVMKRDEIKQIFQKLAPEAAPSVDKPDFLQYDIVLKFEQAPAGFVFQFDRSGILTQIMIDAYSAAQNPPVVALVKSLNENVGEAFVEGDSKIWNSAGWEFIHDAGGDGEDSIFSITIRK